LIEEKQIKWFGHIKRIDRTRISRRIFEVEFKGKRPTGQTRTKCFSYVLEYIQKRGSSREEIEKEIVWEEEEDEATK
jgi:hypothetical protein